jgi:hypothetical protein
LPIYPIPEAFTVRGAEPIRDNVEREVGNALCEVIDFNEIPYQQD